MNKRLVENFFLWARYFDRSLKVSHEVGQVRRSHAHEIAYVGRQQENGCQSSLSSTTTRLSAPRPSAMVHGQPMVHATASSGLNKTRTAGGALVPRKTSTGASSKSRAPASLQRSSGVTTSCTRKPVRLEPLFEEDRVYVNILVCSCLDLSGLVIWQKNSTTTFQIVILAA